MGLVVTEYIPDAVASDGEIIGGGALGGGGRGSPETMIPDIVPSMYCFRKAIPVKLLLFT